MIYHFPCNVKFPDQRTGLGNYPKHLTVDIPIFTDSTIRYVPWEDTMDDTIPTLHLESLKIPPLKLIKAPLILWIKLFSLSIKTSMTNLIN